MNGGVIGGIKQDGKWKIDARFNRIELQKRIERIAAFEDNIIVTNLDALRFIKTVVSKSPDKDRMFVYLDPPYYVKGSELYLNFYQHKDHIALSKSLQRVRDTRWVVTYDNTPQISSLYEWADVQPFSLRYSAHTAREGSELLISPKYVNVPVEVLHESVAAS